MCVNRSLTEEDFIEPERRKEGKKEERGKERMNENGRSIQNTAL